MSMKHKLERFLTKRKFNFVSDAQEWEYMDDKGNWITVDITNGMAYCMADVFNYIEYDEFNLYDFAMLTDWIDYRTHDVTIKEKEGEPCLN